MVLIYGAWLIMSKCRRCATNCAIANIRQMSGRTGINVSIGRRAIGVAIGRRPIGVAVGRTHRCGRRCGHR